MRLLFIGLASLLVGCADDASDRPKILIIGDSHSIGYTPHLAEKLPQYTVLHNPGNAEDTAHGLRNIDAWLSVCAPSCEYIVFNHGAWDMGYHVPVAEYVSNLQIIAEKVKAKTERPAFALSVHVPNGTTNHTDLEVKAFNDAARALMDELGIETIDLYSPSKKLHSLYFSGDIHLTTEGYGMLADTIVDFITQ